MKKFLALTLVVFVSMICLGGDSKITSSWHEDAETNKTNSGTATTEIVTAGTSWTTDSTAVLTFDDSSGYITVGGTDLSDSRKVNCDKGTFVLVYGYSTACFTNLDDMREWLNDHKVSDVKGVFKRQMKTLVRTVSTEWRQVEDSKITWSIGESK